MSRFRRPHSFSNTYSRMRGRRVGLSASHSAVIVLRFVLHARPAFSWKAFTLIENWRTGVK